MKIDAHHHFWHYSEEEFSWISDEMSLIRRDFMPWDLLVEINAAGIDGVISVQARQTLHETGELIKYAQENKFIKGIVGWLPLCDVEIQKYLGKYANISWLKGLRHVVHDEPDDSFILREDFNCGISLLKDFGLVYDILIFEKHLPQTIEFIKKHPDQQFVLDHIAKPKIKKGQLQPWRKYIEELGRFENVNCKISGMVTEADLSNWTLEQLKPYFEIVFNAFGPRRLMFGSDWPVCLCACKYGQWIETVLQLISQLSCLEQGAIMGENAIRTYGLEVNL